MLVGLVSGKKTMRVGALTQMAENRLRLLLCLSLLSKKVVERWMKDSVNLFTFVNVSLNSLHYLCFVSPVTRKQTTFFCFFQFTRSPMYDSGRLQSQCNMEKDVSVTYNIHQICIHSIRFYQTFMWFCLSHEYHMLLYILYEKLRQPQWATCVANVTSNNQLIVWLIGFRTYCVT